MKDLFEWMSRSTRPIHDTHSYSVTLAEPNRLLFCKRRAYVCEVASIRFLRHRTSPVFIAALYVKSKLTIGFISYLAVGRSGRRLYISCFNSKQLHKFHVAVGQGRARERCGRDAVRRGGRPSVRPSAASATPPLRVAAGRGPPCHTASLQRSALWRLLRLPPGKRAGNHSDQPKCYHFALIPKEP